MNIIWFRNDLRVADNPALWHGTQAGPVVALFFLTPVQWQRHSMAPCKMDFMLRTLAVLKQDLNKLGIPLLVRQLKTFDDVAKAMAPLCVELKASAVYWNEEYPVDERARDDAVARELVEHGIEVHRYHDRVLMPPGSVVKDNGEPYQVFTPFKKTLKSLMELGEPDLLPVPAKQTRPKVKESSLPRSLEGFDSPGLEELWPAGEHEAQRRLASFACNTLEQYDTDRDLPAIQGTSCLSPYLAIGAVSPQQCLVEAMLQPGEGATTWINELIWRDFYQHIAWHFPRVCRYQPFKPDTDHVPWRDNEEDFERWCQGCTGVPLVDAGMRQLVQTGWMHNRVRMVAAMFLSKNLLLDWRKGEQFFMEHLIDGEFCANNGGWQWSASTGTDAVPYFRIFNPFTQGERFDPEATYIKLFVPELKKLDAKDIHKPARLARMKPKAYPELMVDLSASRQRALDAFKC